MFGGLSKSFLSIREAAKRQGRTSSEGEGMTIFVSIMSRMIVTPALLLPLFFLYAINTQNIAVRLFEQLKSDRRVSKVELDRDRTTLFSS
jgi:hypothetical protein